MTKYQLATLMFKVGTAYITLKGISGILLSVEREDGSGSSFNVTIMEDDGTKVCIHIYTVD